MDYISLGLVFISSAVFIITFFLAAGRSGLWLSEKRAFNSKKDYGTAGDKNAIVVHLPQGLRLPADYTLDLKVSLRRDEKEKTVIKQETTQDVVKKNRHRLDEYL
ncbi:hypothetical protein [Pelotomaculum propionicicum]|uniref:Uncharacterized protein n=1 Tax=Pelotomaculum propionicicum TaxID=258475 RepID=A0A4Y7RW35_9FIRM|nr:hypothetical protein [Pelotomaculum propionicicum]NLI13883.1 hypothetical protein [Peptococcaceae bacterium]TEB13121.1 hypothetical protein Pmgp_00417 [Pelotomaculum propionicicum]